MLRLLDTNLLAVGWWIYVVLRAWLDPTYPCESTLMRATEMLMLYAAARLVLSRWPQGARWVTAALLAFAAVEVVAAMCQLAEGRSNHWLYTMTGTFANPAPLATALALGLLTACVLLRSHRGTPWRWHGIPLREPLLLFSALTALLLLLTGSRAALIAAAVGLLTLYRHEGRRWRWVVLALVAAALPLLYFLKPASALGRLFFGGVSVEAWRPHLWTGCGVGSFYAQYGEAMARYSQAHPSLDFSHADVVTYPFNVLLHIGVEQGVVGVAFALLLTGAAAIGLWRNARQLLYPLAVLLMVAQFSYPFSLTVFQVLFALLLAVAAPPLRIRQPYLAATAIGVLLICMPLARREVRQAQVESDYGRIAGLRGAAFLPSYYKILDDMGNNSDFLFNFAKILREQRRWNDSNEMLRRGSLVSADPMFVLLQGRNYESMSLHTEAAAAYRHAFQMMPNRLYPIYCLMRLHLSCGHRRAAQATARRLLRIRPKIDSSATRRMRQEAADVLQGNRPRGESVREWDDFIDKE